MSSDTLNRFWLLLTSILVMIIIVSSLLIWNHRSYGQQIVITSSPPPKLQGNISVDGAILNPGIYPFSPDESLNSIIQASGGVKGDADLSQIHLSIPGTSTIPQSQKVDINRADIWLLEALPEIGETRARAIIDYRIQNGLFRRVDDILKVPGISASAFEKLKPLITVTAE
jgi:competence protein ComEA